MSDAIAATHFEAPEVEEVARLFPSYEILELIACGGMGAVYHAIQTSLDRAVAIKILPREFSMDAEFRAGFESEAKAMAKLNHTNLIGVYDFGEAEGLLFIVMEYVAGQSIFHAANGCPIDQADTLAIVIGVCHGLANAHDHGILHRDIKPSNILLEGQTNPKIGDFGLAGALGREIVEGAQIFGTPGYTAPEVLEPPFKFDQRADIFSVGVMLHELLTGQLPDVDPRPASKISQCDDRLDTVIQRATHPDPNRRFASAMELAQELEKIASTPNHTLRTSSTPNRKLLTASTPNRKLLTASTPAATSVNARKRASASAAPSIPAVPSRTTRSLPTRPQKSFTTPITTAKKTSRSGLMTYLVVGIVAAAVIYLLMKGSGQKTSAPGVVAPSPPLTEAEVMESLEEFMQSERASIRQRVGPAIESCKRDMKANLLGYKSALEPALRDVRSKDRERVKAILSENFQTWENNGHQLPQALPDELKVLTGAEDLHAVYSDKQDVIQRRFDVDISSYSGIYILQLQKQIGRLEKEGNSRGAATLQEEVRATTANPDRFRTLLLN